MQLSRGTFGDWFSSVLLLGAVACGDGSSSADPKLTLCEPMSTRICACADARPGTKTCAADGQSYGECTCTGPVPGQLDAGGGSGGGSSGSSNGANTGSNTGSNNGSNSGSNNSNLDGGHLDGGKTDAGTHDAATQDDPQTPGQDQAQVVACGSNTCVLTLQNCCTSGGSGQCTSPSVPPPACAGTKVVCDGPEDCSGTQVCCVSYGTGVQTRCASSCTVDEDQACHTGNDCGPKGVCNGDGYIGLCSI